MSSTAIEWATDVWNPTTGCDRVSPGCAHCYALELAPRLRAMGLEKYERAADGGKASGPAFGVTLHPDVLHDPFTLGRRRDGTRRRIFVNSMSDLFHEQIGFDYIDEVFAVMALADQHDFLVLTKRPERMADYFAHKANPTLAGGTHERVVRRAEAIARDVLDENTTAAWWDVWLERWPLANVWLGVTIENRRYVDRADILREVPAAVRFISAEPLLGPLVYDAFSAALGPCWTDRARIAPGRSPRPLSLHGIDWLIVGGESGPQHRPCAPDWVRRLRDHAQRSETAFFFKQWGGRTPKAGGRELDGRTWDELPATIYTAKAAA